MSKKKKKSAAAENLIESLMDDLKDIHDESSYNSKIPDNYFSMPLNSHDQNRVEANSAAAKIWANLESGIIKDAETGVEKELEPSDFSSAEEEVYSQEESFDLDTPPIGFGELPVSESLDVGPSVEEEHYDGPSADAGYQAPDELFVPVADEASYRAAESDATHPVGLGGGVGEDKTVSIQQDLNAATSALSGPEADKTIAVEGFANARLGNRKPQDVDVKVSIGSHRGSRGAGNVMTSVDASLAQAENLKLAQQRILELEKEVEHLRSENEELASAAEIIQTRTNELGVHITVLEKEKVEIQESSHSEILILKGNLQYKENEVAKARVKVEELETRLKSDFKKIRVRERELENRLELLRAEKSALVRSKDEYILEQKRKIDQLSQELDNYRKKCLELNKTIAANQDQVKRTERALRLALTNLEAKEENNVPLKKAE